jgi:hypothetical protein
MASDISALNRMVVQNDPLFPITLEEKEQFHLEGGKETVTKLDLDSIVVENDSDGEEFEYDYADLPLEDIGEIMQIIEYKVVEWDKTWKRSQN